MKRSHNFKTIDILFALLLFAIFAISVLLVLLSGGRIYKGVVDDMTEHYQGRTSISYIVTKLRHCDSEDAVAIEQYGDSDALMLTESGSDGKRYVTTIYLYDGTVREQYNEEGKQFAPETGTAIVDVKSIHFSFANGNMVLIEYETANGSFETYVHLRSKGAVS